MSDTALRSGLIRLAYANPDLRPALLPLLKKRAGDGDDMAAVLEAEADPTSHDQNLPEHYYYGKTAEERLENIEKLLSQFAAPASKNQNKPQSYYGLPPKGKQASVKTAGGSGAANAAFLRQSPLKNKILQAVAKHYGVSVSEIEAELTDPDAEALYEYIGNDRALAMTVYRDMKAKGL